MELVQETEPSSGGDAVAAAHGMEGARRRKHDSYARFSGNERADSE